jgi:hypothetical protein
MFNGGKNERREIIMMRLKSKRMAMEVFGRRRGEEGQHREKKTRYGVGRCRVEQSNLLWVTSKPYCAPYCTPLIF